MRRCFRNAALALGAILFASNTFSNSCSLTTLGVYAAEDALAEEVKLSESTVQTATIQTGEENVETEVQADEPDPDPSRVEEQYIYRLNEKDYITLLKIVEAEAGTEDLAGKMLVANVIMNRVNSGSFPDTVTEVVYQKHNGRAQFSPTVDGRIDSVRISPYTVEAVSRVMQGEDNSNGALYFRSVRCTSTWFDNALTRVIEHGNHIFYIP